MDFSGEVGELFSAVLDGFFGGVGFLIPAEGSGGGREEGDFVKEVLHGGRVAGEVERESVLLRRSEAGVRKNKDEESL